MTQDILARVEPDRGLITPDVYASEAIYRQELERVFGRAWLYLAHESQFKKAGDYITTYMGADSVIVIRQKDGSIKAFLNACRHRGMRVAREDRGNAKMFTCAYHGWSYGMTGALETVPHEYGYGDVLDRKKCGLVQVAQVATYRGLIFGNFDHSAPSLEEYLGDMKYYLDAAFNRTPGGIEVLGGVSRWRINCNWKMAAEQFAGDNYHGYTAHTSAAIVMSPPGYEADFGAPVVTGGQFMDSRGHGSGFLLNNDERAWGHSTLPRPLQDYLNEMHPSVVERIGEDRARMEGHNTVFPNFSYLTPECPTIRVWHPKGPGVMEVWSWTYVDSEAPPEIKDEFRRLVALQFSASGLFEQDDGDNWAVIQENLSGAQVRRNQFNFQFGLPAGENRNHSDYPGTIGPMMGEMASRGFFRWWKDMMTSEAYPSPSSNRFPDGVISSERN